MPHMSWGRLAFLAIALLVLALYTFNLFRIRQFNPSGVVAGLVIVFVIVGLVSLVSWSRYNALRRSNPKAFVANIAIYPQARAQLARAAATFAVDAGKIGSTRSASLLLDENYLRLFSGSGAPREIFALPAARIRDVTVVKAAQGSWTLDSLRLQLESDNDELSIDFCLMNTKFGFPHALSGQAVKTLRDSAAKVLHS